MKGVKKEPRKLTAAWLLYYGREMGMNRREVMETLFGEMLDMISCHSIYNGNATEKIKKKWTYEEAISLR